NSFTFPERDLGVNAMRIATQSTSCSCPGFGNPALTRRQLLQTSATGFGWLALSALLGDHPVAAAPPGANAPASPAPHFKARAKNVIFCFMDGGVSQVDSFDPKPKLAELDGKELGKVDNPTVYGNRKWRRSPWEFKRYGKSGLEVSDLFPHIGACADELTVI